MLARTDIEKLKSDIRAALGQKGLRHADLAASAGVDVSQVSRICRGDFRRISENVMRICTELEIEVPGAPRAQADPLARRLQAEVLNVWDKTPEGARHLMRLMQELSALSGAKRRKAK